MGNAADAAADPEILRLENLETDIPPPAIAIDVTRNAIGKDVNNSYLPFLGQDALRKSATAHVSRISGVEYDWSTQCIISAGGLSGIFNCLLAILASISIASCLLHIKGLKAPDIFSPFSSNLGLPVSSKSFGTLSIFFESYL